MTNTSLEGFRQDSYILGQFDMLIESLLVDYQQGEYEKLLAVYDGAPSEGMQLGGLLAQTVVEYTTAFEFGDLPTPVVINAADGKEDKDLTAFSQRFLTDQQVYLFEAIHGKNMLGDVFVAFNLDRNLEAISPLFVDPGFYAYSGGLESAKVATHRYMRAPSGRKVKILVEREYTPKDIIYSTTTDSRAEGIKLPKIRKITNPLGVCPIVMIPNKPRIGGVFGFCDFQSCIPYFYIFHKTMMRGFESQQYSGNPILLFKNIEGPVKPWLNKTFGIDIDSMSTTTMKEKIFQFFKLFKIIALSDNADAEFLESKLPLGKTSEVLDAAFKQICRLSMLPEFLWGAQIESSNATVREQYAPIKAVMRHKRMGLEKALRTLIKWSWLWYTNVTQNPETGETFESYGIMKNGKAINNFKVDLIWPEFLGSDQRVKIEALAMLANAKAVSRRGLLTNYKQYIPSAEIELANIKSEEEEFGSVGDVPQTTAQKEQKQRRRNTKSNQDDNQDANQRD